MGEPYRRTSICMVVHHPYPLDPRVARETEAARRGGHDVDVVALREGDEAPQESIGTVGVTRLSVPGADPRRGATRIVVESVAFATKASLLLAWRFLSGRRYDVVHVHTPPDFLVVAGLLPRLFGARLLLDIHDRSPLLAAERLQGTASQLLIRCLSTIERMACRVSHEVITVHAPYVQELVGQGISRSKLTIVMNSPNERVLARAQEEPAPWQGSEFLIAYHGTIDPWYGVPLLVRALAQVDDVLTEWHATVLGDGDAMGEVRDLARGLGVDERIEFTGRFLPIEQALARVRHASCGVIPNLPSALNELTLSTKLLEYVALGVPVVVSRLRTLSIHFDDREVTFFEPGNATSLARALEWVAQHPEEAHRKADRAQLRYREYAWPVSEQRYLTLLKRLVSNGSPQYEDG